MVHPVSSASPFCPQSSQHASPKGASSSPPHAAWPEPAAAAAQQQQCLGTPPSSSSSVALTPSASCGALGGSSSGAGGGGGSGAGGGGGNNRSGGGNKSGTKRGTRGGSRNNHQNGNGSPGGSQGQGSPGDGKPGPSIFKNAQSSTSGASSSSSSSSAAVSNTQHRSGGGSTSSTNTASSSVAVTPEVVFPREALAPLDEPPNRIEVPPHQTRVQQHAASSSSNGSASNGASAHDVTDADDAAAVANAIKATGLLTGAKSGLAISTPAELMGERHSNSSTDGATDEPPHAERASSSSSQPLSPNSPIGGSREVRFSVKKVVLDADEKAAGPRLVAGPRGGGNGAGGRAPLGEKKLSKADATWQDTVPGLTSHSTDTRATEDLRQPRPVGPSRQRSINIDPSDAALKTRKVGMQVSAWLPPPSPAPGKDVAKRIRDTLLLQNWSAAALQASSKDGNLGEGSLEYLCTDAELISMCRLCIERKCWASSSLVKLRTPLKIFGDIHGQFADLQRFFAAYGSPNPYTGDVEYVNYCFLGDYVDRGKHSLEVICLLLALKICHPSMVTLLRGNHEDPQVNAVYGFRNECMARCREGAAVWQAVNRVFEFLPVAALVDNTVLCVHGGIGESLQSLQQLKELPRPAKVDLTRRSVLNEVLWSDPTDSDERVGCHPNARGPNTVSYGPDRVRDFCEANKLKLLVRAHQCVQDGFEFASHGRLLTVFSAPNYGARWTNDAAMLVLNRELHVFPKVLKSRGKNTSVNAWVHDPKRPFTPPRPRPTQPQPISVDDVVYRGIGSDSDEEAEMLQDGASALSERISNGSTESGRLSPAPAVPAAHAVSVTLDAGDSSPSSQRASHDEASPQGGGGSSSAHSGSHLMIDEVFAVDELDEPASAPSALLAQRMAEELLLS